MDWRSRSPVDPQDLAKRVRAARLAKHLSQAEVAWQMTLQARELHDDPQYPAIGVEWVRRVETGQMRSVTTERIMLLAPILGVSPTDLVPPNTLAQSSVYDVVMHLRALGTKESVIDQIVDLIRANND